MFVKRILPLVFLLFSKLMFAAQGDILAQYLSYLNNLEADFKQQVFNEKGKLIQTRTGTVAIKKPNKFRWFFKEPQKQLLVSDGKVLWIYQPQLRQAIKKPARSLVAKTPIEILTSTRQLRFYFRVAYRKEGSRISFFLTPKNTKEYFKSITLTFLNKRLDSMKLKDQLGHEVLIHFTRLKLGRVLNSAIFEFVPPGDTDVFD